MKNDIYYCSVCGRELGYKNKNGRIMIFPCSFCLEEEKNSSYGRGYNDGCSECYITGEKAANQEF